MLKFELLEPLLLGGVVGGGTSVDVESAAGTEGLAEVGVVAVVAGEPG